MGFSVPSCLRLKRWALTPPFHPYPGGGGLFSVALSVNRPRGQIPRVYLRKRSYAASRPTVFGLSSPLINQGSDSPPFQHGDPNTPRGRKQGYRMDPFRTRLTPPLVFAQVPDPPARLRGIFPVGLQPGTKDPDGQKSAHAESRSLSTEPSRFEAPGGLGSLLEPEFIRRFRRLPQMGKKRPAGICVHLRITPRGSVIAGYPRMGIRSPMGLQMCKLRLWFAREVATTRTERSVWVVRPPHVDRVADQRAGQKAQSSDGGGKLIEGAPRGEPSLPCFTA